MTTKPNKLSRKQVKVVHEGLRRVFGTQELAPTIADDAVNHPSHYTSDPSGVECITITRHRSFNIGNAMKYLWRAGLKRHEAAAFVDAPDRAMEVEDLNKAVWYLVDEIKRLGGDVTVKLGTSP